MNKSGNDTYRNGFKLNVISLIQCKIMWNQYYRFQNNGDNTNYNQNRILSKAQFS